MRVKLTYTLLASAVLWGQVPTGTATSTSNKRPKIGLALSGGSALGLAHVGVIQWFEEHHIPIDYIAGTSMGGLVGGLYASGYSATEMEKFVGDIDWQAALSAGPPYRQLAFRRKEDAVEFPTAIEIGFRDGRLRLPTGLSAGHNVGMVISRFAAPYGELASFDDLPTPFRCVATDLAAGERVVFDKGSLTSALRSTMSLPSFFAPIQDGQRLLVDGGLVENIPVSVVRDLGADIVIAVALQPPRDPKAYLSLLGVAGTSIGFMITENELRSLKLADLIVSPDLKGFQSSDYTRYEDLRKQGYAAAEQKSALLSKLAVTPEEWNRLSAERHQRKRTAFSPEAVRVVGNVAPRRKEALESSLLHVKSQGPEAIEDELTKLTGMGRYDSATYEQQIENGKKTLVVRVHEKTHGPPFLRPSLTIDAYNGGGGRVGLGGRFVFLDALGPASEWRTDFNAGTDNRLVSEYYWRVKGGKWFIAPSGGIERSNFPLYFQSSRLADFDETRYYGRADLGYAFGRFQEIRLGYQSGWMKTSVTSGAVGVAPISGRFSAARILYRYDGTDSPYIPRSGIRTRLEGEWFTNFPFVDRQFPAYRASITWAHTLRPKWSLLTNISGGGTVNEPTLYNYFTLGGLFQQSALAYRELLGNKFYYASGYALRSLNRGGISLFGRIYAIGGYELGRAWWPELTAKPRHSGVFGIAGETQFGVLFLGGAIGDQGDHKLLFRLGRLF